MKVTERSRLLGRKKPSRPAKLGSQRGKGEETSFRHKLDWRWLCRCIAVRGVASRDVEDVAQEVLLLASRVLSPPPPLRPGQTAKQQKRGLLRRIVRCQVCSYFRHMSHRSTTELSPTVEMDRLPSPAPMSDEALEEKGEWELLGAALGDLQATDPKAHALVEAHMLELEPMPVLIRRLSVPLSTAWRWLFHGKLTMRAFVRRPAAKSRAAQGGTKSW